MIENCSGRYVLNRSPALRRRALRPGAMKATRYSQAEEMLAKQIRFVKLPEPGREYRFAAEYVGLGSGIKDRLLQEGLHDWRFDFAWPGLLFAVEVEGVTAQGGRHQRIGGFLGDIEKYHAALSLGWIVYRTTGALIKNGAAISLIEKKIRQLTEIDGRPWG